MRCVAIFVALAVFQSGCALAVVRPPTPATRYERADPGTCTTSSAAPGFDVAGATVTGILGASALSLAVSSCHSPDPGDCPFSGTSMLAVAVPLLLVAGAFTYSAVRGLNDMDECRVALDQLKRDSTRAPPGPQAAQNVPKNVPGTAAK